MTIPERPVSDTGAARDALALLAHAEREADALSNAIRTSKAAHMAYELRKTLAELRLLLRTDPDQRREGDTMTRGAIEQYEMERADTPTYFSLHRKLVTARKDHVCSICGKSLPKGSRYVSHAMIYDGDFTFQREHYGDCP